MPDGVVVDPVLRQRFSFERSTEADGGEVLRVEIWVEAGGGVTPRAPGHGGALSRRQRPAQLPVGPRVAGGRARRGRGRAIGREARLPQRERGRGPHRLRGPSPVAAAGVSRGRRRPRASGEAHPPGPAEESECPAPGSGDGSRLPRDGGAWLPSHAAAVSAAAGLPPLAHLGRRRGYRSGTFAALA